VREGSRATAAGCLRPVALAVVLGCAVWAPVGPATAMEAPGTKADAAAEAHGAAPSPAKHEVPDDAAPEPGGFWTGAINSPVPRTIAGGKVIHSRKLAGLLSKATVVVVDVSNAPRRPDNLPSTSTWLPVPHPAIKGAIWIPGAGLGELPADVDRYYRERLAKATGNDMGRAIVVYCHEKCWLSWNGAKRAIQYGYREVYWFPDGIEGWRKAGLPTQVVTAEPVP
jgi:PQQ-dependent catabolism-associated CXXCW motif protein